MSNFHARFIRCIAAALAGLLLGACAGQSGQPPDQGNQGESLSQQLERQLHAELAKLGKDPQRTPAAAPQGAANTPFNLEATVLDEDGPGGAAPTGIELRWTARMTGDYDQNGEVGISDITPLGQQFKGSVDYDAPELHAGISFWPSGDPRASGSANWRSAAVDGDGNGEINAADITPVAVHFAERMDGYNIYLKQTGENQFSILPNLENPFLPASTGLPPAGNGPRNYTVTIPWPSSGAAEIAVAGYDDQSGSAAALSNIVSVSGDPGSPAQPLTAELTVAPLGGPAPLSVSFGLGASSSGGAGDYRYVLATGEAGQYLSSTDVADFPLEYSYTQSGSYQAQLAVVNLESGGVAFSSPLQISVTEPLEPGLSISGRVWQYETNPELGSQTEPPKNPLDNIEVELYILGEATPIATVHSNASGLYVFSNVQLEPLQTVLNLKISAAQKAALLPLSWLPDQQILILQEGQEDVTAPDMNLLATPI